MNSPAPASTGDGCEPGQGGVPGPPLGNLVCGQDLARIPSLVSDWATDHWSLLAITAAVLVVLRLTWAYTRRRNWRTHATSACWLEITPPVTATPIATIGLWRLLATLLPAPRRCTLRPARLVWEVAATPNGTRCGLWAPPGVNPTAVRRVLQRAWPGARIEQTSPPQPSAPRSIAGLALRPTIPEAMPLLDDHTPARRNQPTSDTADQLRAVFDALAAAGRTGGGLLQIIVGRAPRHRVAAMRRASINPRRPRRSQGSARAAGLLAAGLRGMLLAVLDFVTPGPGRNTTPHLHSGDSHLADLARQARVKASGAPHLLVAIHATATGPTPAAAKAAAADITSGFGLVSAHLTRRRLRRPRRTCADRWAPEHRMTLMTVTETAALAGLPAEPAAYGLPQAASRRRPAGRDTWCTP
ncbi:MAG: hypothetical protein HKP61_20235 [Dactylosporangium sp.]|nr:hypothetical protein [Dactylosporangium sp.]NNJ63214.1 hypothetical protein [Dactylosporangium sp.]